jgi:serine phosphatase RsbU (regulator of sigma subunit)
MLKYLNAGHIPPLVVRSRNGSCEILRLDSASIPVGISADPQFAYTTFQFEIDDVLVAYTDGITEAVNRHGELWGQHRLENLLRSCGGRTPQQIIDLILNQISTFANGQPQQDDVTLVVMGVQEGCDV